MKWMKVMFDESVTDAIARAIGYSKFHHAAITFDFNGI